MFQKHNTRLFSLLILLVIILFIINIILYIIKTRKTEHDINPPNPDRLGICNYNGTKYNSYKLNEDKIPSNYIKKIIHFETNLIEVFRESICGNVQAVATCCTNMLIDKIGVERMVEIIKNGETMRPEEGQLVKDAYKNGDCCCGRI